MDACHLNFPEQCFHVVFDKAGLFMGPQQKSKDIFLKWPVRVPKLSWSIDIYRKDCLVPVGIEKVEKDRFHGRACVFVQCVSWCLYMGVSKNKGTPKSSILIGFSIINHPFWGVFPLFLETPICFNGFRWVTPCTGHVRHFGVLLATQFLCTGGSGMLWINNCLASPWLSIYLKWVPVEQECITLLGGPRSQLPIWQFRGHWSVISHDSGRSKQMVGEQHSYKKSYLVSRQCDAFKRSWGSAKAVSMATNFVNVDVVFAMKTAATSDQGAYDSSDT